MQMISKTLLLMIGFGLFVSQAHSEVCDWAKKTPADDANYKYFVAREFSTKSRAEALRNAENDITQQVCNIVGNYLSAATDSYEDEDITNSTSSTAQRSRCLGIYKQNFEKLETDDGRVDGEYIACVKYRYLKDNLKQEQARINKEGTFSGSLALTEYIGNANCEGHPLEIKTNPSGAFVSIDDRKEYRGQTPLRFGNVCNGTHTLTISLDNYDTIEQKISSTDKQIFKKLDRSTKRVRFTTSLGGSTITVYDGDGFKKKTGKEPLEYDFLLGVDYKIGAENVKANNVSINRTFNKDSDKNYTFRMDKLNSRIDFSVFKERNPGVRIFVDNSEIKGDETGSLTPDERHRIVFKKSGGYKNITDSVYLSPNETHSYPSKQLNFDTDESIITKYDYLNEAGNLWVGLTYGMGNYSNKGFETPLRNYGISGNLFLGKRFSLDLGLAVGGAKNTVEYNSRDYATYIQNTSAASLFQNYDTYYNITIEQTYAQLYGGISWYMMQHFWFSPFLSVGYNQFLQLSSSAKCDSNIGGLCGLVKDNTNVDSGTVMGGIGVQMGFIRVTGRLGTNYQDVMCGISIPIKL